MVLIIGGPIFNWKLLKWWLVEVKTFDMREHEKVPLQIFPSLFGSAVITLVTQLNGWSLMNLAWLKIWIAPKVFLLEYVATMVK